MNDEEETQAISDARQTRQLVIAAVLRLAGKAIEHVETHDVALVQLTDDLPAGGFQWHLSATYSASSDFVRVQATPVVTDRVMVSPEEMARIMGNDASRFDTQVPREWIALALKGAEDHAFGFNDGVEEAIRQQ